MFVLKGNREQLPSRKKPFEDTHLGASNLALSQKNEFLNYILGAII